MLYERTHELNLVLISRVLHIARKQGRSTSKNKCVCDAVSFLICYFDIQVDIALDEVYWIFMQINSFALLRENER